MFSFYSIHVFISGPSSLYTSAHRGGHAQNYSSVVYTAAPQETAAVSGFKQMISRLDTATSAVLHQLCGELQHQSSRHRIKHLFATSSDQTRLHANTLGNSWGFVRMETLQAGWLQRKDTAKQGSSQLGLARCDLEALQLHGEAHVPRDLELPLEECLGTQVEWGGGWGGGAW